ncbi:hypothetical protein [Streptomyces sp. NPDC018833]|uniref:hypothetical protein n=1 Tax=Streptomyces sp. NPDC018833 TaxID=3365053 RepID=UPI0037884BB6
MNDHHPVHSAGEITALRSTGEELLTDAASAGSGRAARTVVALPGLRVTLLALSRGRELAEHRAPGAATLLCLSGRVTLSTADRSWPLERDDLVDIPDQRHQLVAETDALVLLTVRLD